MKVKKNKIKTVSNLILHKLKKNKFHYFKVNILTDAMAHKMLVPVMVAKGKNEGPVLGLTAAVHGNELNGIPIIHEIFKGIDLNKLHGTLVAIPVFNISGYLQGERTFNGSTDLNRIMPGKKDGSPAEQYCHYLLTKIVKNFGYILDLHTASFGRANSLYVRADLINPICAKMAILQGPQIVLNIPSEQGTLRKAAEDMGIYGITIEVGDPHLFQDNLISDTVRGIKHIMQYLRMFPLPSEKTLLYRKRRPVICSHSYWLHSPAGGILKVHSNKLERVLSGQVVATIYDVYGQKLKDIVAKEKGIIIAVSTNPACQSGGRVVHIGIEDKDFIKKLKPK